MLLRAPLHSEGVTALLVFRHKQMSPTNVMPAEAGIQPSLRYDWTPACAGVTLTGIQMNDSEH